MALIDYNPGHIPTSGPISLGDLALNLDSGARSDISIAALRYLKNTEGNANTVHLSAMRDWCDAYLGDGKPAGFPSGDEVSFSDFRDASILRITIQTTPEDNSQYKNQGDGKIEIRAIGGSGEYEFRVTQVSGAAAANYNDTTRGIFLEAANTGPEGNDIFIQSGGSTASSIDTDLTVIRTVSISSIANDAVYNVTITGDGTSTISELLEANASVSASDYNTGTHGSLVVEKNETLSLTGGSASTPATFSGSLRVLALITAQRTGSGNTTDITLTGGNDVKTVATLFSEAGISVNIDEGADEVLAAAGVDTSGAATDNDLVLAGGSTGTTILGATQTWNTANPDNEIDTATITGGSVVMSEGETIELAGGAAGFDSTKTLVDDNRSGKQSFYGLGGSSSGSVDYVYRAQVTDTITNLQVKLYVKLGLNDDGGYTASANQYYTERTEDGGSSNVLLHTDSTPDGEDYVYYASGPEDTNSGGLSYGGS